jgi:hypothetical protein
MPFRDRVAIAIAAAATAALPLFAWLAAMYEARRLDVFVLAAAAPLQLTALVIWIVMPRLPRWIVLGYGIVLVAAGLGFTVAAPAADPGAAAGPWSFVGLLVIGVAMILAAMVHRPAHAQT